MTFDHPAVHTLALDPPARVIAISGANRSIGIAIAREFRRHGYRLSLGAPDPASLVEAIGPESGALAYRRNDASDPGSAYAWVDATLSRFGQIDVLINNAGMKLPSTLHDLDHGNLDTLWSVNVKAPLLMTQLCLPHLEKSGAGRVVNIASLLGRRSRNPQVGFSMTEFALMALTHTACMTSWDKDVRAIALCPGFVRTEFTAPTTKMAREDLIAPETLATLARTLVELPNTAAVAELRVSCHLEDVL